MPGPYSWITYLTARQELSARLADSSHVFWTDAEVGLYIKRALQMFNALTFTWKTSFNYSSTTLWNSLGTLTGSPRLRTVTDTDCYKLIQYHLLEPPSGGTWTGTSQFSLTDLQTALQYRRDEMLLTSACNDVLLPNIALTPNTIRTLLPDNVLDVPRVRNLTLIIQTTGSAASGDTSIAIPSNTDIAVGQLVAGTGVAYPTRVTNVGISSIDLSQPTTGVVSGTLSFYQPTTLYRDDTVAQEFYEDPLYQLPPGTPQTFSLSSEPPLVFQVDVPPASPGVYEAVVLEAGTPFAPPASTLIGIPDDFAWALEWGALADLLGRESQATDSQRAAYCLRRYQDGLNLLLKAPWIMLGSVNNVACTIDALSSADRYYPDWDADPANFGPMLVTAGVDFLAAPTNSAVGMTVLGNAPLPSVDGDFVQVSRANFDTILDLAQSMAAFKMGGADFEKSLELEQRAIQACAAENARLKSTGSFSDILIQRGTVQDRVQNRYNTKTQAE